MAQICKKQQVWDRVGIFVVLSSIGLQNQLNMVWYKVGVQSPSGTPPLKNIQSTPCPPPTPCPQGTVATGLR